jgi:hypothetical protein
MLVPLINFGIISPSSCSGGGCMAETPPALPWAVAPPIWGVAALDEIEGETNLRQQHECF